MTHAAPRRADAERPPKKVLFACIHNAGRSQIAAAFFNQLVNRTRAHAVSAGTAPAEGVHPAVVTVMREAGIDLTGAKPQRLTDEVAKDAGLLVTMGCGEACPFVPGARLEDWPVEDPTGQPLERVRQIRDEVRHRVERLIAGEGWA